MSNRIVVVGGFTTSNRLLEPVADALCNRFGFADADVFEFPNAINNLHRLERALKRQNVVGISGGLLAVAQCSGMERVAAFNTPEPTKITRGLARAAIKSGNLWRAALYGPNRKGSARVATSNCVQAITHLAAHAKQMGAVSRFSTTEQLGLMEGAGIQTARIDTDNDEFFGPYILRSWDGKRVVLPGHHDQVLIDPIGFIAELPQEILAP